MQKERKRDGESSHLLVHTQNLQDSQGRASLKLGAGISNQVFLHGWHGLKCLSHHIPIPSVYIKIRNGCRTQLQGNPLGDVGVLDDIFAPAPSALPHNLLSVRLHGMRHKWKSTLSEIWRQQLWHRICNTANKLIGREKHTSITSPQEPKSLLLDVWMHLLSTNTCGYKTHLNTSQVAFILMNLNN